MFTVFSVVSNLPTHFTIGKNAIKSRLNQLCDNTGGKVINVYGKSGLLKFNRYKRKYYVTLELLRNTRVMRNSSVIT